MKKRQQQTRRGPKSPYPSSSRGGAPKRDTGVQCTAIAISTGVQCKKSVTDTYQLAQKFPKCSIHSESCKNIYPKYKAACAIPVDVIPDNPRRLSDFTTSELQDAVKDAKECTSLRRQYTSECFAGRSDEGHLEIIDSVARKARMLELEIVKRKDEEKRARKLTSGERGDQLFNFRERRSPSPPQLRSPSPRRR